MEPVVQRLPRSRFPRTRLPRIPRLQQLLPLVTVLHRLEPVDTIQRLELVQLPSSIRPVWKPVRQPIRFQLVEQRIRTVRIRHPKLPRHPIRIQPIHWVHPIQHPSKPSGIIKPLTACTQRPRLASGSFVFYLGAPANSTRMNSPFRYHFRNTRFTRAASNSRYARGMPQIDSTSPPRSLTIANREAQNSVSTIP